MSEEMQISIVCPQCLTEYRIPTDIAGKKVTCKRCGNIFTATLGKPSSPSTPPLGTLAVKYNLITREQLSEVLTALSQVPSEGDSATLESLLLGKGLLTAAQIETLKLTEELGKVSQSSRRFGDLAIKKGLISEALLKEAFEKQAMLFKKAKTVRHVKDIFLEEGHLNKTDHDTLMAELDKSPSDKTGKEPEKETVSTAEIVQHYDLVISEDQMTAALKAKVSEPAAVSLSAVRLMAKSQGIVHGVLDEEALAFGLAQSKDLETPVVIARGTPVTPGRDATLQYHFSKDQKIGTLGSHDKIDFKNKGEVPFVHQGDLLLEKIPAVPGKPGFDIFGKELKPPPPSDLKLLFGSGVELSEDRLKLHAKVDGQPKLSVGGRLSVVSDLVINGDVDLKTGHVDFGGNVKITGTIQSGFHVNGADVEAKEIMGAQVIASGTVSATGGIIGAVIKAQGDVKAKYIKHANISTFGDVVVIKEITDSNINTSGACRLDRGKILSSEISAKQGIQAVDIGTDLSTPCRLTVGVDDHIEAETEGLRAAISRREENLGKIDNEISTMERKQQEIHKEIAELAQVQDQALLKQRALKQRLDGLPDDDSEKRPEIENAIRSREQGAQQAEKALGSLFDKQDELTHRTEKLQQEAEQIKDDIYELKHELDAIHHWAKSQKRAATIKVSGSVVQGTFVGGPHTRTVIKETARQTTIREVRNTDPGHAVEWEIKLQHN